MTVIDLEERATRSALERVEMIERVAADLDAREDSAHAAVLRDVVAMEWDAVPPVRVRIAGSILGLSERTVRAWLREGVLEARTTEPRVLLDPERLHQVWHLVRELREAGKERGLLDEVWRRISDERTLADPDLIESLAQMRRGETEVVIPRASADSPTAASA